MPRLIAILLSFVALFGAGATLAAPAKPAPEPILVFAAASLQGSLDEVAAAWTRRSGQAVKISYAGSSALAKQIAQGAPADVFISADEQWMDTLQTQGAIDLRQGSAQGGINLSGTTIDVPFGHLTVPDWAQASGGINASQGAANVNIGGQNGVGADVNLAQGNLDLNIGGHKIDVDQGLRDIGGGISNFVGGIFGR